MVETPPAQVAAAAAAVSGGGTYRETCAKDAERMFTCSILNAFIQAGKVDLNGPQLVNHTLMLRKVWQHTFGQTAEAAAAVPAKMAAGRETRVERPNPSAAPPSSPLDPRSRQA